MARRHVYRANEASGAGAALVESISHDEPAANTELFDGLHLDVIASNPLSGPIIVPQRVSIGDSGIDVHPLALGASTFGWTLSTEQAFDVLDRFAGLGGSLIDTADSYAAGRSESIIGKWLASRGARERMAIATKIGHHPDHRGLSPVEISAGDRPRWSGW